MHRIERVRAKLMRSFDTRARRLRSCDVYLINCEEKNASIDFGQIMINCGLYESLSSDDQLAAVIAHEMGHLSRDRRFKCTDESIKPGLRREVEADAFAAHLMRRAGYDPAAIGEVLRLINEERPHFSSLKRLEILQELYSNDH